MNGSWGREERPRAAQYAGVQPGLRAAGPRKRAKRPLVETLESRQLLTPVYPLTNTSPTAVTNVLVGQPISTNNLLTFTVDNPTPPDATAVAPNSPSPVLSQFTWGDPGTGSTNNPAQIVAGSSGWVTEQPWGYDEQVATGQWSINGTHTFTQPGTYLVQGTVTMTGNPAYDGETILVYTQVHVSTITPPTVSLSFNPDSPTMGETFKLEATVTNNDPNTLTLPVNYTYSLEPKAVLASNSVDGGNSVGKGSLNPPLTVRPGGTTIVDLADFNFNWQWIPPQDMNVGAASSFLKNFLDYNGPGNPTGTNLPSLTTIDLFKDGPVMMGLLKQTPTVIGYLDTLINAILSAASTLGSAVTSQTLDVTASVPYDPQGNAVTAQTQTTIQVPSWKKAHLVAFTTLDNESGVALSGGVGLMLVPGGQLAALGFIAAGIGMLLEAQVQYQQALDPPDPDYQTVPTIAALDSPAIDALVAQQPQEAGYFKALLAMLADDDAEAQAYNKAQGAQQAGDAGWQARQLAAAAGFDADAEAQLTLVAGLQPAMPALPSNIDSSLMQAGWSATNIAAFHQFVAQQTTPNSSGLSPSQSNWQAALQASQTIESQDLAAAVSAQTSGLNQSVTPVSANDAQTLSTDLAAIKTALASGDPTGKEVPAIEAFQSEAISVALATNNLAAVQPDLDAAAQSLALDQQQVIGAHPTGVADPTPNTPAAPVTPTPPSAASTAGPIVSNVAVRTARRRIAAIIISFNVPIAGTPAGSVANYGVHLLNRGRRQKNGVHQTDVGLAVAISAATYDPSGPSVTLTLRKPLRSNQGLQLSVNGGSGGVTDQAGNPLNSPASGAPGNSFVYNLS